jgi:hypothetical protein
VSTAPTTAIARELGALNLPQKIDPKSERSVKIVQLGTVPRFFDVGEGAVWTSRQAMPQASTPAPDVDTVWRLPLDAVQ